MRRRPSTLSLAARGAVSSEFRRPGPKSGPYRPPPEMSTRYVSPGDSGRGRESGLSHPHPPRRLGNPSKYADDSRAACLRTSAAYAMFRGTYTDLEQARNDGGQGCLKPPQPPVQSQRIARGQPTLPPPTRRFNPLQGVLLDFSWILWRRRGERVAEVNPSRPQRPRSCRLPRLSLGERPADCLSVVRCRV